MATRDESLAILESLGVAPLFANSYRNKELPHRLNILLGPPEEFFLAPETQDVYTNVNLVPLVDDGNFGVVLFFDPETRSFVQLDVEAPNEIRRVYTSWQQYLAWLFIRIAECRDDANLHEIAELIGFQYAQRTLDFMDSDIEGPWSDACSEFIASL